MIELAGRYFDGRTSAPVTAKLRIDEMGFVRIVDLDAIPPVAIAQLNISARIGNIPRILRFPNGAQFETDRNDLVDQILIRFALSKPNSILHRLESNLRLAALALAMLAGLSWLTIQFGVPLFAKYIAFSVSPETAALIGQGTLDVLDKSIFEPSELAESRQQRLQKRFKALVALQQDAYAYELLFRVGGKIGPNAFALPSGAVVMTDELVQLTHNDDELLTVLAHEIGHTQQRHGLRHVLQTSVMFLIVTALTGDVSQASGLVATLPTALIDAQYSQTFEREADNHALLTLRQLAIDPVHFKNLMLRIEKKYKDSGKLPAFLSSHPATEERVKLFDRMAAHRSEK